MQKVKLVIEIPADKAVMDVAAWLAEMDANVIRFQFNRETVVKTFPTPIAVVEDEAVPGAE